MIISGRMILFCFVCAVAGAWSQENMGGAVADLPQYNEVTPQIGTGGQMTDEGIRMLAAKGYKAVISLRTAEEGIDLEAARKSVEKAGMEYYSVPFSSRNPEAAQAAKFMDLMGRLREKRVFVHCATANRVGSLMMIKRVVQDGLTDDQAIAEAVRIGLRSDALRKFALDVIARMRSQK